VSGYDILLQTIEKPQTVLMEEMKSEPTGGKEGKWVHRTLELIYSMGIVKTFIPTCHQPDVTAL
jgi:hypothetical protein